MIKNFKDYPSKLNIEHVLEITGMSKRKLLSLVWLNAFAKMEKNVSYLWDKEELQKWLTEYYCILS